MSHLTIAVFLIYFSVTGYANFVEDYCWRDYDGVVPPDALKAGKARDGGPIYVGQTLYEDKLVPGKIHDNVKKIHIEVIQAHVITENIKILCTEYPEMFEWIQTNFHDVLDIKDKHLFEGGFEKDFLTYVGRAVSHDELTVGKVVCFNRGYDRGCYKLTTVENGTWYDHGEFEVLTYNPDVVKHEMSSAEGGGNGFGAQRRENPGFWSYFLLVLVVGTLIVLVVFAVRRWC